jgi:hypothetical protein
MAEIMAVLDSGLPRIFATLLFKFLDRNLLIGLGDNCVSPEHSCRLPASDGHDDRLSYASATQSTRGASPKIVNDLADVANATAATLTLCCYGCFPAVAADHLSPALIARFRHALRKSRTGLLPSRVSRKSSGPLRAAACFTIRRRRPS